MRQSSVMRSAHQSWNSLHPRWNDYGRRAGRGEFSRSEAISSAQIAFSVSRCELHAIAIQDKVFLGGVIKTRRCTRADAKTFVVA